MADVDTLVHYLTKGATFGEEQEARDALDRFAHDVAQEAVCKTLDELGDIVQKRGGFRVVDANAIADLLHRKGYSR